MGYFDPWLTEHNTCYDPIQMACFHIIVNIIIFCYLKNKQYSLVAPSTKTISSLYVGPHTCSLLDSIIGNGAPFPPNIVSVYICNDIIIHII